MASTIVLNARAQAHAIALATCQIFPPLGECYRQTFENPHWREPTQPSQCFSWSPCPVRAPTPEETEVMWTLITIKTFPLVRTLSAVLTTLVRRLSREKLPHSHSATLLQNQLATRQKVFGHQI